MKKKLASILVALSLLLALPSSTTAHGGSDHGIYPWNPGGTGGHHTLAVCLGSMYGGTFWNLSDSAHARLWEAMQAWHNVYGSQALIRAGSGNVQWSGCPSQVYRVYIYVVPGSAYPFYGNGDKMTAQHSQTHISCPGHWPPGGPQYQVCNQNSSIYINDDYLWYVGPGTPPGGSLDFESALIHELGHTLGLSDIGCTTPYVMCNNLNIQQIRRTLHYHDVFNLQYLYNH